MSDNSKPTCADNCENLSPDRIRCEPCRTINLARLKETKPMAHMQPYDDCLKQRPCLPVSEMPCIPICIRVCNKEDYMKCTCPQPPVVIHPPWGHGRLMFAVKALMVAGTIYFTYRQGVWGEQPEVVECMRRWREYYRSFHSRRPPKFDPCGRVIHKESSDSLLAPFQYGYKFIVTTVFSGVVKFPEIIKCMYNDYLAAMHKLEVQEAKERRIRRQSM